MKEDFSVPKEFQHISENLFKKKAISEREFVDLCLLSVKLIDSNWSNRQGMAYHIVGAWMKYPNIDTNDLLDKIGGEFATLELPDAHVGGSEEVVRGMWRDVALLVKEADKKFPT